MFLDNTDIINKLFPVNNSVPLIITMASPAGNTNDVITYATDELVTVDEAIVAAVPAKAINIPAKNANTNILPSGIVVFPFPPLM